MSKHIKKEYKIYVVGSSTGYARWIEGTLTDNMEEADLVLFTGGEDISPSIYGEEKSKSTYLYLKGGEPLPFRDRFEIQAFNEAKKLDKPMWGTCRGAQLLCALAGGKLIQDMVHYGHHKLHFYDGEYTCTSNSLHHQMQYPYNMKEKEDYIMLAHSYGLSTYYLGGDDKPMDMPEKHYTNGRSVIHEPEFVYYPKIKSLGIQGHPEMMGPSEMVTVCHSFLNLLIEGHLDNALKLNLKVQDIMQRAWDFKLTKEEESILEQTSETRSTFEMPA